MCLQREYQVTRKLDRIISNTYSTLYVLARPLIEVYERKREFCDDNIFVFR
jgi:hypothetical protein